MNSLFSGLAFAGVIYAIVLQTIELRLQRKELDETQKELKRSADAQSNTEKTMGLTAYLNALSVGQEIFSGIAARHLSDRLERDIAERHLQRINTELNEILRRQRSEVTRLFGIRSLAECTKSEVAETVRPLKAWLVEIVFDGDRGRIDGKQTFESCRALCQQLEQRLLQFVKIVPSESEDVKEISTHFLGLSNLVIETRKTCETRFAA